MMAGDQREQGRREPRSPVQKNLLSPSSVIGAGALPPDDDSAAAPMPASTPAPMAVQNHQRCHGREGGRGLLGGGSVMVS